MKQIFKFIVNHIREDFHISVYIYTVIFLSVTIYINFSIDFEDNILDSYRGSSIAYLYHFLFFAFAYYMIAIPQALLKKNFDRLKDVNFWLKSFLFIALIGFISAFYYYKEWIDTFDDFGERYFLFKLLSRFKRPLLAIIPLLIIKYFYDRDEEGLYGIKFKNLNLKPYLIMLALVLPLIVWASFQEGFLKTYPRFKPWVAEEAFGMAKWQLTVVYEFIYGVNFVFVELLFRGTLIIGMASIMGKDSIFPMVSAYAFLHFGKPLPECISSIFGGYIIGVFALYTRNIFGGIVIHVGVAYAMEFAAFIQYHLKPK